MIPTCTSRMGVGRAQLSLCRLGMTLEAFHPLIELPSRSQPELELTRIVRLHGGAVSHAAVSTHAEVFRADGIPGAISYRQGWGCAVSIGEPMCPPRHQGELAARFRAFCLERGWHTVYVCANDRFAEWARTNGCATVEFGEELIMNPQNDPTKGSSAQRLRGKVSRARRDGVEAREYVRADGRLPDLEAQLERVAREWLDARTGPQIYLSPVRLFDCADAKRWFYATQGERIVGVLQMVRLETYGGYLFSQLFSTPDAPPGTTELLGVAGLKALGAEGCDYVTWGPAPAPELGRIDNLGPLSEKIGRAVFRTAGRAFHLEARNSYRRKFPIAQTKGSYLIFDPPQIGPRELLQVLSAFHASVT